MKKGVFKIIAAVAALCAAIPCAVSPVFANSGHRYEFGVSGAGIVTPNGQSVLAVKSEKLTFNISDFPDYSNLSGYQSTVTAEYSFVNTSDSAVTTSMAFPIGFNSYHYDEVRGPDIKVNGEKVDVQTRHTFGQYENFRDSVKYLLDDYYADGFYTPDKKVTHYKINVDTGSSDGYRLVGSVECGDGARFVTWLGTEDSITKYLDGGNNEFDVYVIGDTADFDCTWKFEKFRRHLFSGGDYVSSDRTFPISETVEETTLKDFVLSYRDSDSAVSEKDWYNAFVSDFGAGKYISECNLATRNDYNFLTWYVYEVQAEPNGTFTNTVTAPLLPSISDGYSPAVYDYEYYLSPAASWKSFGTLDIVINTDYYLTAYSTEFTAKEGGYAASFAGLPKGELTFSLCSVENPSYSDPRGHATPLVIVLGIIAVIAFFIPLAGAIVGIVYLVKNRKKK